MSRRHWIEAGVFVAGLGIGVACAGDSSAQTTARVVPDDTVAVSRLLGIVRGANPLVCEMTTRAADVHGFWMNRGSIGGSPLVMDSASAALLDWAQRSHNDPAIVPRLAAAMRDEDACVRRVAASLMSRVQHLAAVAAMVDALGEGNPGTREVAALALGMANAEGAAGTLQARLRDEMPGVRRAAAWALGEIEAKNAVPTLIDVLAKDPDARVRQAAAWAIGNIK
jgi:HEAT repeat protein